MYCVFCGNHDVISCQRCGRWVCPRHAQPWLSRIVCVGCRRRLFRVLAAQLAVVALVIAIVGTTVYWVVKR
jgi:hypothetical protein